jgi:hypothetical protein
LAGEPSEKDSQGVIERTCRIVLDVKINIREITPQSVAAYFTPDEDLTWEWAERQNRLLKALVSNSEALGKYLVSIAKDDLGALLNSSEVKGLSADEEDDLLERVYSGMDDQDALFFLDARRDRILYENTELVDKSFVTDWTSVRLMDVYLIRPEDSAGS